MGCATSKIENEEVVALCGTRKKHIKDAVSARHNFAAAFSGYVIALRITGSAFSQFGEAEFRDPVSPPASYSAPASADTTPVRPSLRPPPLPNFYNSPVTSEEKGSSVPPILSPLKRSASLPPLNLERKNSSKPAPALEKIVSQKGPKNGGKKKVKASRSPTPEPEMELEPENKQQEMAEKKKKDSEAPGEEKLMNSEKLMSSEMKSSGVKNNVKVSSGEEEDDEDWVAPPPPPPPVPSAKPPPPPPPPTRPSWLPDFFEFSSGVPLASSHHDEDEFEKQKLEEDAKRRKQKEDEEKEAQARKEEEEMKLKQEQELELQKKQKERMIRRPSTVDEGEEEEDDEDDEEDDEEEDEEEGEDEEEEEDDEEEEEEELKQQQKENLEPEEPKKQQQAANLELKTDLVIVTSHTNSSKSREELVTVLKKIDKLFQDAYESGRHVAAMLEAQRVSFHPNFIDNRSNETHAKKVLRAISWTSTSVARADPVPQMDEEETGSTHASSLDRLLAWEKKLYDEVKRAEAIRVDLDKKNSWVVREESRGGNPEAIEKAKANVKSLQTRVMVAFQGVETARNAVLKLRDSELYPQLLELIKGIHDMWRQTHECHVQQYDQVMAMKKLEVEDVVESSSNLHKVATEQLKKALSKWHHFFGSVISSQQEYMKQLNLYVRVSVKSMELDKDRIPASSPRLPISTLCHEWQQALDRLPDKRALEPINNFVAELEAIVQLQNEEARLRKRVAALEAEVRSKRVYVEKYEKKHLSSMKVPASEQNGEVNVEVLRPITEKRAQLEVMINRLEEEREKVERLEQRAKHLTINSLQIGLPNIFYAVKAYSKQCFDVHESLQQFVNHTLLTDK